MPKICVICFNVPDMDIALQFYRDKLGFEVEDDRYYPDIVELEHEGAPLILFRSGESAPEGFPNMARTVVDIETEDLASRMEELRAKGVEFIHEIPQPCPVGVYAAFKDPFGNVHELLEFKR